MQLLVLDLAAAVFIERAEDVVRLGLCHVEAQRADCAMKLAPIDAP